VGAAVRHLRFGLIALLAACAQPEVPAMYAGDAATPPPGTIVFVRPPSPCDTTDHARIVAADGRFVGALGPGTWFAVQNYTGDQIFYVWPGLDLRLELHPEFQPVDVVHVRAGERKTTYIGVRVHEHLKLKCWKYATFRFTRPAPQDAERWMHDGRELVADRAEGQAVLVRDADVTRAYLQMAKDKQARRGDE
jgi:hypothetical protein